MIQKTKNYSMFKFRDDNREKGVCPAHVKLLIESIKKNNLLDMCPILVNSDMEIVNGQHRVKAAEALGVDIYYEINERLTGTDIILMNTNKNWSNPDILNYYVKNHYPEYMKLDQFLKHNNVSLKIGLSLLLNGLHDELFKFKHGEFVFDDSLVGNSIETCWETIHFIRKINGQSFYTNTARFWKPMVRLFRNEHFDLNKWRSNLRQHIDKFFPRANTQGYVKLIQDTYNWKNHHKIDIMGEDTEKTRIKEV
jgi:ParB-like nuclease domain